MDEDILVTVKKMLGLAEDYGHCQKDARACGRLWSF